MDVKPVSSHVTLDSDFSGWGEINLPIHQALTRNGGTKLIFGQRWRGDLEWIFEPSAIRLKCHIDLVENLEKLGAICQHLSFN